MGAMGAIDAVRASPHPTELRHSRMMRFVPHRTLRNYGMP